MQCQFPLAYIYDCPKNQGVTAADLSKALCQLGYPCEVQVLPDAPTRPHMLAQVRFESMADLHLALSEHKSFKVLGRIWCRLVPNQDDRKANPNKQLDMHKLLESLTEVLKLALAAQKLDDVASSAPE